ncbi:Cas4 exonuclease [Rhodococcus phage Maselop]|nr:Cas4 exonuclease [Rhodococcus phage Braxoaddie]WNM64990.1 Cas4 exonuclease [Rhodococcus phage Maselop]
MTQIDLPLLRTSERKDFKRCPQRWWWAWRDGLRPAKQKHGALWFGTGIHLALEKWYVLGKERGRDPVETWREFVGEQVEFIKVQIENGDAPEGAQTIWVEAGELGEAMLTSMKEEYGLDDDWEVLAVEESFEVKIAKPGTREAVVVYAGTFDLVARQISTGKVYLWDHKTAKSIQTGHLPLDDQAGSYWALANYVLRQKGIIGKREFIHGIVYNFLMKSPPDKRPRNADGLYCNQPKKEHYLAALIQHSEEWPGDEIDEAPIESVDFSKLTLKKLQELAEQFELEVFGEPSEKQPAKRFKRVVVERTRSEQKSQIERIGAEAAVMEMFRDGTLPLIKNPTKDCQWDCDYRDLCELDENGGDTEEYISLVFKQEDPYAAHRLHDESES